MSSTQDSTPFALALGLGLVSSSYFFYGNLGAMTFGPIPLISSPEVLKKTQVDDRKAIQLFKWFYKTATPHMAGSALISGVSLLTAGLQLRRNPSFASYSSILPESSTQSHGWKTNLLLLAAAGCFAIPAWTVAFMLDNNNVLCDRADQVFKENASDGSKVYVAKTDDIQPRFKEWKSLHLVRVALGGFATFASLAVLFLP